MNGPDRHENCSSETSSNTDSENVEPFVESTVHLSDVIQTDRFRISYWDIVKTLEEHVSLRGEISHFIILPYFSNDVIWHTASCFASLCNARNMSVVMLASDCSTGPTASKNVISEVTYIDLPRAFKGSDHGQRETILFDLIRLCRPSVVHNFNSDVMWRLTIKLKDRLAIYSRVFCSIFAFNHDAIKTSKVDCATSFMINALPYIDAVLTDSRRLASNAIRDYNLDCPAEKFITIYTPLAEIEEEAEAFLNGKLASYVDDVRGSERLRVVWLDSLDVAIRPDLLIEVATLAPGVDFHLYDDHGVANGDIYFEPAGNVFHHGSFSSALDVVRAGGFHALMFTSRCCYIPDALVAFGALGLPVIAPRFGEIEELIDDATGYVVSPSLLAEDYVESITKIKRDPEGANRKAKKLAQKIRERHSWAAFSGSVDRICGY